MFVLAAPTYPASAAPPYPQAQQPMGPSRNDLGAVRLTSGPFLDGAQLPYPNNYMQPFFPMPPSYNPYNPFFNPGK